MAEKTDEEEITFSDTSLEEEEEELEEEIEIDLKAKSLIRQGNKPNTIELVSPKMNTVL